MNVYEIVTDRILAELEKGKIPWENRGLAELIAQLSTRQANHTAY